MSRSDITLPQLGETVEEAVIIKWFKSAGENVNRGGTLLEAETDKITVEVPALVSGTLVELVAAEGETVAVGAVIAKIDQAGAVASGANQATETSPTAPSRAATSGAPQTQPPGSATGRAFSAGSAPTSHHAPAESSPLTPLVNKLRASPAARATARQLGIDLAQLRGEGTGPLGRITKADVLTLSETAASTTTSPLSTTAGSPTAPPASYAEAVGRGTASTYELTRVEQVSARLTAQSFQEVPHFYVTLNVDVTTAMGELRALPEHRKVSINDALVKVTALALEMHPRLNSTLQGNALTLHPNIDIGVITATDDGVITSVVPGAAAASLGQIRSRVREVRARLKTGQAQAGDVSGATFCISNMGMYGVDSFSAIILQPNVAILAVGALKEEVLVNDGKMHIGQTLALTVSADHRAVDGVAVALFLKDLERLLAEPERWLGA